MEDRDVQFPNRYRVTKIEGTDGIYDFEPVPGEVNKEGSLVNKSLLFADIASKLFGLYGIDATPNKAFEYLGKFNLHWWKRRSYSNVPIVETDQTIQSDQNREQYYITTFYGDSYGNSTLKYANDVYIDTDGSIKLLNPETKKVYMFGSDKGVILGKYVETINELYPDQGGKIYYIPASNNLVYVENLGGYYRCYTNFIETLKISETPMPDSWKYLQSYDRFAYPDSGEQDGYEYQYLGVPFENLPDMPKIEMGSYVGNGKYGKSNPNSLTFSFTPKFWGILTSYEPGVPYDRFRPIPDRILLPWGETLKNPSSGDEEMVIPSYDGNKVSWYSNRGQDAQCSSNNYVYYYFAIA